MSKQITYKEVQVHEQWPGGAEVYTDFFQIKWQDLAKRGVKRKKDKRTGERYLAMEIDYKTKEAI